MNGITVTVSSFEELVSVGEHLGAFVFRGHGSVDWSLESTLERAATRWNISPDALREREETLLREFQRRAHHYISNPPGTDCILEWTALLQHYGGPTRLLDVTHSYLIATFFAIERAERDAAVWAFNTGPLSVSRRGDDQEFDPDKILAGSVTAHSVRLVKPFRQNLRLATQQGLFLMPPSIEVSFMAQINETVISSVTRFTEIETPVDRKKHPLTDVWKIVIPEDRHSRIMRSLSQANISAATLFEGLEGFARSLYTIARAYD